MKTFYQTHFTSKAFVAHMVGATNIPFVLSLVITDGKKIGARMFYSQLRATSNVGHSQQIIASATPCQRGVQGKLNTSFSHGKAICTRCAALLIVAVILRGVLHIGIDLSLSISLLAFSRTRCTIS